MKKIQKFLAVTLAIAMVASSFTGCSKKAEESDSNATTTEAPKTDESGTEESGTEEAEATATPAPTPTTAVVGDTSREDAFYVYSYNTDAMNNVIAYFNKYYPEEADRIVYVNTGGSNYYQTKLDAMLQEPSNSQYPDLYVAEIDYLQKYTDSDYSLDIAELGITPDDYANQYPYTLELATVDGKVKGLSWQAAPGALMYRRSLAKEYLGTEEPDEVQEYFKDWDTMLETGKLINEKSGGKTKLFSGVDDVKRVYQAARTTAWYDDNSKITVDPTMLDYMDYAKQLYDLGLTNNTTQWTDAWSANAASDSTFAYMGCTWFLQWTLKQNCGGTKVGEGTYGDWAMCAGPQSYYWGGCWLCVSPECSDKDLAAKILKAATCNTEIMKEICKGSLDYVNNKEAVAQLADEGEGTFDFLGGQDFLKYFSPLAESITLPPARGEDFYITLAFDDQVTQYTNGSKTKEEAVADFETAVVDLYPYLSK